MSSNEPNPTGHQPIIDASNIPFVNSGDIILSDPEKIEVNTRVLDLGQLTPMIDRGAFHEATGLWADLVATVEIGKDTSIGIIDRRPYLKDAGLENLNLFWTGIMGGSEHMGLSTRADVLAVVLAKKQSEDGEGTIDIVRDVNGAPIYASLKSGEPVVVGRDPKGSKGLFVPEKDTTVSRNHLHLDFHARTNSLIIKDLESTNGSYLRTAVSEYASPERYTDLDERAENIAYSAGLHALKGSKGDELKNKTEQAGELHEAAGAERPLKGEDSSLIDVTNGLFGVFDGAGGHAGGAAASQEAARVVSSDADLCDRVIMSPEEAQKIMKSTMVRANDAVTDRSSAGVTTATVVKIHKWHGREYATWSSVGDSRLYVYNKMNNELRMLSHDEGRGHILFNAIGDGGRTSVDQIGSFELSPADTLMLCTDGVTGDYENDILHEDIIKSALYWGESALKSAEMLVNTARKHDDRTCIVIR